MQLNELAANTPVQDYHYHDHGNDHYNYAPDLANFQENGEDIPLDAISAKGKGKGKGYEGKGSGKGGKGKGKSGGKAPNSYFEGYCGFCGKWGHKKADCRNRLRQEGGQGSRPMDIGSAEQMQAGSGPEIALACSLEDCYSLQDHDDHNDSEEHFVNVCADVKEENDSNDYDGIAYNITTSNRFAGMADNKDDDADVEDGDGIMTQAPGRQTEYYYVGGKNLQDTKTELKKSQVTPDATQQDVEMESKKSQVTKVVKTPAIR